MSAKIVRNATASTARRADMVIQAYADGALAPRGTDFTGYVYVSKSISTYTASLGTLTNKRRPLVVADDVVDAVDDGADTLELAAHGLETGDGPLRFTTTGTLPAGLALATDYYVINPNTGGTGGNLIKVATSLANAYAGTAVNLTSAGTGTHTLSDTASTARGIDGHFTYEFTQAETDVNGSELASALLGHATYYGYTSCILDTQGSPVWETIIEAGRTAADLLRGVARTHLAKRLKAGTLETTRDLADTKNSHHGTVTASGRTDAVIDDLT